MVKKKPKETQSNFCLEKLRMQKKKGKKRNTDYTFVDNFTLFLGRQIPCLHVQIKQMKNWFRLNAAFAEILFNVQETNKIK